MTLLYTLLVLAPGLIASAIQCSLDGIPYKSIRFFVNVFIYAFLIQCFVLVVLYLRGHGANAPDTLFDSLANIAKYACLSLTAAVLMPGILIFVTKFYRRKK